MEETNALQFEQQALEQDIKRLVAEIETHRNRPEAENVHVKEIIKQTVKVMTPNDAPVTPSAPVSGNVIHNPLPDYATDAPAETKLEIEYLLELAFHKGILKANEQAQKSSPFVMDAFHDALAGKLYDELQKRGMVE